MAGVAQICDLSLFDIIAFIYFCYFHYDRTELDIVAFSYFCYFYCDKTELDIIAFSYLLSHCE